MPATMLWAWERPENLMWLDGTQDIGVAFLAQTLVLSNDEVVVKPRRQPLEVPAETYLVAVTRIESSRSPEARALLSLKQQKLVSDAILKTLKMKNVKALQLDFDALVSERPFYSEILNKLKPLLPEGVPLSITALTSWCVGDRWIGDLPVDEVVPMIFDMGTDEKEIYRFLAAGKDWTEPRCRDSYGIAVYEPVKTELKVNRRMYFFNKRPWTKSDMRFVNRRSSS